MKIAEAESILRLEDMTYDTAAVNVAYMRALRDATGAAERRKCASARNTLERYVTSLKKSGQFGAFDTMSSAISTVGIMRDAASARRRGTQGQGNAAGDGQDTDADRLSGRRRYPKSNMGASDNGAGDAQRTDPRAAYARDRAACRPSGNGGASFGKAVLMTLWDATPWRWFLCFWSLVVGVLVDVLGYLGAIQPGVRTALAVAMAIAFWVGVADRATGLLWKRAMPASARRIDAMR